MVNIKDFDLIGLIFEGFFYGTVIFFWFYIDVWQIAVLGIILYIANIGKEATKTLKNE